MDEKTFQSYMGRSKFLCSGDYLAGYTRGLRRHYHGKNFGTGEEHGKYMNPGDHHIELGHGYQDGFNGKPPKGQGQA